MSYAVTIRDAKTGETRVCRMDDLEWNGLFWWKEGNAACDCNRGMFFEQAIGIDTDAMDDDEWDERYPCGHGRYVALYATMDDGTLIPID